MVETLIGILEFFQIFLKFRTVGELGVDVNNPARLIWNASI